VAGLLVSTLADDGPAARAGLLVGDVIVQVGSVAVGTLDALRDRLQVGAQVQLTVARGGQAQSLSLEVAPRPDGRCT